MTYAQAFLLTLFDRAVAAVDPARCVPPLLPPKPTGRTVVFAYGKAAASMAVAVEAHWDGPVEGIAVTRYQHGCPLRQIRLIEAGHPYGDDASERAARDMLALAQTLGADDLALCLVSGGGSALASLPAPGLTADDKRQVLRVLHASGAPIGDINTVRRRLSAFKGGRLAAAAAPAHVHSIVISDIPGDDPSLVASGPSFPDPSAPGDARRVLARWGGPIPESIDQFLDAPIPPVVLGPSSHALAATAMDALNAAAAYAEANGVRVDILSDRIEGEASALGARDAAMVASRVAAGERGPLVLLSGGETSVTVTGTGRGGRNAEYLAAFAIGIAGLPVVALAADTDGIDGSEDNAGTVVDGTSLSRAAALGLDAQALLTNNDAYALFDALGDLVVTGPTRTNVNDFRAILIGELP